MRVRLALLSADRLRKPVSRPQDASLACATQQLAFLNGIAPPSQFDREVKFSAGIVLTPYTIDSPAAQRGGEKSAQEQPFVHRRIQHRLCRHGAGAAANARPLRFFGIMWST